MDALHAGASALDAAVEACVDLEDDPRFNAGTGSNLRFDGKTIEMDAACMDSTGRFGAVACIRNVRNPVKVARALFHTPHNLLAGDGATRYARRLGFEHHDPWTGNAQVKFDLLWKGLRASKLDPGDCEWDPKELAKYWNYEVPLEAILGPDDTVGAVVFDGKAYAAALSTGGTMSTLLGRVGDVPLPGCGLHAGPAGAVAVTGDGDHLARAQLASRIYRLLETGMTPEEARDVAFTLFAPHVDVGLILLHKDLFSGGSNRQMAWSWLKEEPRP
jgi:isoaspartyl peptidase/L-asparaginase-like protein (Ntn-hydrolase superfamily)